MTNREKLSVLGFSLVEIDLIEFVLLRMGVTETCKHTRPRFVECYSLDEDTSVNEARWQKFMREMGFRGEAIELAERGIFGDEMRRC